ncbi:MAG TPA: ferritin-like domain-containing protein [Alphaproteobacteria bacterium]
MDRRDKFRIFSILTDLMQIDVDATRAYSQAIAAIHVVPIRRRLEAFRSDHERHIEDIEAEIRQLGMEPPSRQPDLKGFLLAGYTAIRSSMGVEAALRAMRANETLTNQRYETAAAADVPEQIKHLIERNLLDERRHIRFIQDVLQRRSWEHAAADAAAHDT